MEWGFTSADTTEARQTKGATPIALRRHKRRASRNRSLALVDRLAGNDTLNGVPAASTTTFRRASRISDLAFLTCKD
jgi:hypothetical protein